MEKEGLIRGLAFLLEHNISIGSLTTDRHPGIKKYMRLHQGAIPHHFDVWHVAKGKKHVSVASFCENCRHLLQRAALVLNA